MEMAVEYAKERKQFGRPIGSYQAVSHRCAQMLLETEGARSAAYYAAWAATTSRRPRRWRRRWRRPTHPTRALRVTDASLQVHGGIGFTWEHDLHLWLKRALSDAVLFGDARWHREQVAQMVIDGPAVAAAEPAAVGAAKPATGTSRPPTNCVKPERRWRMSVNPRCAQRVDRARPGRTCGCRRARRPRSRARAAGACGRGRS